MLKKNRLRLTEADAIKHINTGSDIPQFQSEEEIRRLFHELEVHQIELCVQNEELQLAKEKAETVSAKYQELYEFSPGGYFTLNRQGKILELNRHASKILSDKRSDLVDQDFRNFIHVSDRPVFDNFIRKMLGSAKKQHCEIRITGNQNSLSFIHLEGIASKDKEFIVSAIDISKHRIVEDTLRKSELLLKELNATKDKFFSIIAHDLRGPFSSVIGYSDIIISAVERENYKDLPKYALIIQNASLQAMNLLSNLLIWSRLQTGKINPRYEKIDIRELLGDVINLMDAPIRKKSINISHNLSERMELLADREMLNNIFRNLISNAIKYSYPDGIINIDVTISAGFLHVVIQDNGMGIEPDRLSQLFRINSGFTTRGTQNEEGSGLGLLLCREFITKLRGKIWAESIAGEGSKFCFMIPLK